MVFHHGCGGSLRASRQCSSARHLLLDPPFLNPTRSYPRDEGLPHSVIAIGGLLPVAQITATTAGLVVPERHRGLWYFLFFKETLQLYTLRVRQAVFDAGEC